MVVVDSLNRLMIMGLALFLSSIPFSVLGLPDTALVATVNGEAVTQREFMLQSRLIRPLVINDFRISTGVEYSSDFWSRKIDGKTPMEVLKRRTMDALVKIKVQQIRAKKAGIVADISYSGFLTSLKTENERRLNAKNSGKVIYGPVQYTEEVYYDYLFTNMVNRLKDYLAVQVFRLTDEKLMESYDKEKDSLFRKGFYTEISLIKVKKNPEKKSDNFEKTMIEEESTLIFNDSIYAPEEDDALKSIAKETARKLAKGQCSKVIEFQGSSYMICVKEKKLLGYRNFDNCKTAVRILLLDRMYDQYINGLVKEAKCELNMVVYDKIQY